MSVRRVSASKDFLSIGIRDLGWSFCVSCEGGGKEIVNGAYGKGNTGGGVNRPFHVQLGRNSRGVPPGTQHVCGAHL